MNGFIADVEKAFLMISVRKCDRDALRFLWVKDPVSEPIEVQVLRFKRVAFGVTASPFLLNATMRYHIESYQEDRPELVQKLLRSVYVDDVISGTESATESKETFEQFRGMLASGGFNLRKYVATGDSSSEEDADKEHKVLGVNWNTDSDEMSLDLSDIAEEANLQKPTKRHVVSITSKFYDPVGFISPVIIPFKMFLQQLHCAKVEWDDEIDGELLDGWKQLIEGIRRKDPVVIPRCCVRVKQIDCQYRLVGFSDSSLKAYAAVVYLQWENGMSFIASKTRVSPLKSVTIPRLELLGALLLARLITCVHDALRGEIMLLPSRCFTDSQITLYWIKGERREWKPFVYNRVKEIRSLVPSEQWSHCEGKQNPADIPSRGSSIDELRNNQLWWEGPKELSFNNSYIENMPSECSMELRVSQRNECSLFVGECMGISRIIDIRRYSEYNQLMAVTGYVLKFVESVRVQIRGSIERRKEFVILREEAENIWIKEVQRELTEDKSFKHWKAQLQLFLDERGVWRCGGRLRNADLCYATKYPILLPRKGYFIELIIRNAHSKVFHNGIKETFNEVRSRFWVLKGRSVVRKLVHDCVLCRKLEGMAYATPSRPPLPAYRVTERPPFFYTGVDFAGPIFVKNSSYELGGKVWLCLYTCLITRAIHLDLIHNMSFEFFFRSMKRFISRRGLPHKCCPTMLKRSRNRRYYLNKLENIKMSIVTSQISKYNGSSMLKNRHGGEGSLKD